MIESHEEISLSGKQKKSVIFYVSSIVAFAAALCTVLGAGLQVYDRLTSRKAPQFRTVPKINQYEKAKQLFYANKINAATDEARKSVQSNPNNCDARKLLAACYGMQKNMEACATEYKEAIKLDQDDDEALIGLGTALEALGDNQGAKDIYARVVGNPHASPARREHARVQMAKL